MRRFEIATRWFRVSLARTGFDYGARPRRWTAIGYSTIGWRGWSLAGRWALPADRAP